MMQQADAGPASAFLGFKPEQVGGGSGSGAVERCWGERANERRWAESHGSNQW